jgi:hypothetical protein
VNKRNAADLMARQKLIWKKKPESDDLANAQNYLSLVFSDRKAKALVKAIAKARAREFAAKDLLRASGLALLARNDPHVDADLHKIHDGKALAPVLLVRGDAQNGRTLIIADGYHRVCAAYYFDENRNVDCRMASDAEL